MYFVRQKVLSIFGKKSFRGMRWEYWDYVKPGYSQFGEDRALGDIVGNKRGGFFVDVGCFHPMMYSNTYYFYKILGWRGINIDPNIKGIALFNKFRPEDTNICCAVGEEEKEVDYYDFGKCAAVNTCSSSGKAHAEKVHKVKARRLEDILTEAGAEGRAIDLMSVDCEGLDVDVLKSNDWNRFRPRILLVEDHGEEVETETVAFLRDKGYKFFNWVGPTKFFKDCQVSY